MTHKIRWLQHLQRERKQSKSRRKVMWMCHHPYFSTNWVLKVNAKWRKQLAEAKIELPDTWIWADEHEILVYPHGLYGIPGVTICNGLGGIPEPFHGNPKADTHLPVTTPIPKRATSNTYQRAFIMMDAQKVNNGHSVKVDIYSVDGPKVELRLKKYMIYPGNGGHANQHNGAPPKGKKKHHPK